MIVVVVVTLVDVEAMAAVVVEDLGFSIERAFPMIL